MLMLWATGDAKLTLIWDSYVHWDHAWLTSQHHPELQVLEYVKNWKWKVEASGDVPCASCDCLDSVQVPSWLSADISRQMQTRGKFHVRKTITTAAWSWIVCQDKKSCINALMFLVLRKFISSPAGQPWNDHGLFGERWAVIGQWHPLKDEPIRSCEKVQRLTQ